MQISPVQTLKPYTPYDGDPEAWVSLVLLILGVPIVRILNNVLGFILGLFFYGGSQSMLRPRKAFRNMAGGKQNPETRSHSMAIIGVSLQDYICMVPLK